MARSRRGGGGGGKVTPTPNLGLDQEATRVLNLSVLRRLDPAVTDILITAAHVATYSFDEDILEWPETRGGVAFRCQECCLIASGSIAGSRYAVSEIAISFLCKWFKKLENTQPRFQLVVMNRLNTDNLVEDLLTNFEHQVEVPYVMYRNAADEIIGIWFYNPQECQQVAHLFSRIKYAFSKASPKANLSSKSEVEELKAASGPSAVPAPAPEDTLEQPTSPTMVPSNVNNEFLAAFSKAASYVDDTIGGTDTAQPHRSFGLVPSYHESHSAAASQPSALHNQFPSRTMSVPVNPFAHRPHSTTATQPTSLVKPAFLAPTTSAPTTTAGAASSLFIVPPLHPSLATHQPQSAPLPPPFPQPTGSLYPPYGMPLLQPFPPPNPSPLLTPIASYSPMPTRDQVKGALLRLVQNDNFIDMVYREIVKR
ncbi:hypothetical protein ACP70R_024132 [Stipagrostis hirtigluma subsp. patula]